MTSTHPRLRSMTLLAPLLVCGILVSGCTSDSSTPEAAAPSSSTAPGATPSPAPEPSAPGQNAATTACDEVVAGIDAFNLGDLEETVAAFERALPLAQAEDDAAGTELSGALLEAVQYYADLAPEDYPAASTSSPDFAKYKAITLGQCASDGQTGPGGPGGGDDDGVLA